MWNTLHNPVSLKTFHLSAKSSMRSKQTPSHRYRRSIVLGPTVIKMLPWHSGPQHLFILILFCQVMQIFGHESSVDDWWRTKCLSKKFELSRPLGPPFNDLIHRTPNEASSWQQLHCFEDARDKRKGKINFGAEKHVCWVENFSPVKIFAPAINLRQGEGKQSGF